MLTRGEVESRLVAWAEDCGGGRYENIGWSSRNILTTLEKHGGFVPDSGGFARRSHRTVADDVDDAVKAMQRGPLFRAAFVLRIDYFQPTLAMDQRLLRLRAIGVSLTDDGYMAALEAGKAHLAVALSRPRQAPSYAGIGACA